MRIKWGYKDVRRQSKTLLLNINNGILTWLKIIKKRKEIHSLNFNLISRRQTIICSRVKNNKYLISKLLLSKILYKGLA